MKLAFKSPSFRKEKKKLENVSHFIQVSEWELKQSLSVNIYLPYLSLSWAQKAVHQIYSSICETVDVIYDMQSEH